MKILSDLDESYTRKLRRRARKVVMGTGRRSQRKPRKPSRGVGEAYCPPRLTEVAHEYGLEAKFALDLTVHDPQDGLP